MRALKRLGVRTPQANEAANRALSSRCPQNVKFSKSVTARVGSAILTWNNGPGDAQRKISHRLGLPMSRGQKTYHAAEQKRNTYSQRHRRSASTQTQRLQQDAKTRGDKCSRPNFQPAKEEKRGVIVAQSLWCVNYSFVTPLFKLHEEIRKPGRG